MPDDIPEFDSSSIEPLRPIATRDDVKWALGDWLLGFEKPTAEQLQQLWLVGQEMEKYRELCLRLKTVVNEGLSVCFFSSLLRQDIRRLLDQMDQVDAGVQLDYERRNAELKKEVFSTPTSMKNQANTSATTPEAPQSDVPWDL